MTVPSLLYKYQSLTPNALANIAANQIWFSRPATFNDPFDCAIRVDSSPIPDDDFERLFSIYSAQADNPEEIAKRFRPNGVLTDDFRDHTRRSIAQGYENRRQVMLNERGVACFSAVNDNILMWSHYSAAHTGFCLEYSSQYDPFPKAFEVIYADEVPSLNPASTILEEPPRPIIAMVTTKAKDWAYEQEWRIFHMQADLGYHYVPEALAGVYFGARMPESHRLMIALMLSRTPTRLYQMSFSPVKYGLEAQQLTFTPLQGPSGA